MNDIYKKQVALLIRIMPSVYRIKDLLCMEVRLSTCFIKTCLAIQSI